jgi:hypothetical protein
MTIRTIVALLAAGAIAVAGAWTTRAQAAAQTKGAAVIDLSAQPNQNNKKKKKKPQQKTLQPKGAPSHAPKSGGQFHPQTKTFIAPKSGSKTKKSITSKGSKAPPSPGVQFGGAKKSGPPHPGVNRKVLVYKPKHNNVTSRRLRGVAVGRASPAYVHGRHYSAWRGGGYRVRYHNGWRTFVPLSALAILLVGTHHYYPYAYISAPRLYCDGLTEDGCVLNWEEIETLEGDLIGQCVAYCPWEEY